MELVLVKKILENIFNGGNFAVILPQVRREFLEQVTDSWRLLRTALRDAPVFKSTVIRYVASPY